MLTNSVKQINDKTEKVYASNTGIGEKQVENASKSRPRNRIVEVLNSPPQEVVHNQVKRDKRSGFNVHASEGAIIKVDDLSGPRKGQ